jgi:hypothetical protein
MLNLRNGVWCTKLPGNSNVLVIEVLAEALAEAL